MPNRYINMTLTPIHPLWSKFTERFWHDYTKCDSSTHCPTARKLLQEMAFTDAETNMTVEFFLKSMGAACDCEILAAL